MSLRTAASAPQTTPMHAGSRGRARRGRSSRPGAPRRRRVSAISAAMAPAPTGVTSSAFRCSWPRSAVQSRAPTTHTRSPLTMRQRPTWARGTFTSIWAARSRRVKKTQPPRDVVGRCTSPSTATRPTVPAKRASSPASRTSVTGRGRRSGSVSNSGIVITCHGRARLGRSRPGRGREAPRAARDDATASGNAPVESRLSAVFRCPPDRRSAGTRSTSTPYRGPRFSTIRGYSPTRVVVIGRTGSGSVVVSVTGAGLTTVETPLVRRPRCRARARDRPGGPGHHRALPHPGPDHRRRPGRARRLRQGQDGLGQDPRLRRPRPAAPRRAPARPTGQAGAARPGPGPHPGAGPPGRRRADPLAVGRRAST